MNDVVVTSFDVVCSSSSCPRQGVRRAVQLQEVGDGIVARPSLLCRHCGSSVQAVATFTEVPV